MPLPRLKYKQDHMTTSTIWILFNNACEVEEIEIEKTGGRERKREIKQEIVTTHWSALSSLLPLIRYLYTFVKSPYAFSSPGWTVLVLSTSPCMMHVSAPNHLWGPLLDLLQYVCVFHIGRSPAQNTALWKCLTMIKQMERITSLNLF